MKNLYEAKKPLPAQRHSSFSEEERRALAYELAADSIVLLKNEGGTLPLKQGESVAVFGRSQIDTIIGGFGSGSSGSTEGVKNILDELTRAGLRPVEALAGFYREQVGSEVVVNPFAEIFEKGATDLVNSGIIYEIFGKYQPAKAEYEVPADILRGARQNTDTAVLVLGRSSGGEECDRHVPDDYILTPSEQALTDTVCTAFPKVTVVLNVNGVIDTGWIEKYPSVKAVVFLGCPGQEGAAALADILVGNRTPCGKLSSTFARAYGDYSTAETFSWDKDHPETIKGYRDYGLDAAANSSTGFAKSPVTLYREGVYLGYRYFDTFEKEVSYPFGFGLSYADFSMDADIGRDGEDLTVQVAVKNTSAEFSGREVAEVYVSAPDGRLEKPWQELRAFAKTGLLQPGESETLTLAVPFRQIASYDEASASYVLEPGIYAVRVGNSSRNTAVAGTFEVTEPIVCAVCENRLGVRKANEGKIHWLTKKDGGRANCFASEAAPKFALSQGDIPARAEKAERPASRPAGGKAGPVTLEDVAAGKAAMEDLLGQMSVEELATLAVGYGPGLPFGGLGSEAPPCLSYGDGTPMAVCSHKTGNMGYVSPAMPKYGIPSIFYKDGPAWVGGVSWPTGTLLACSFNVELLYRFGACCGFEAAERHVDSWLAPALNLHRNPIGGRNFEYFSEDPLLAGACGVAICRGAEENSAVTCCPKHFAVNEQETYRRGSARFSFDAVDSILSERAARELYLKPFEMVVKGSHVSTFMSSFNKINGTFAAGNADLCTHILREEWGYDGVVVTDWGDMDMVVDGADAVAAGNDVIMPGGPPVAAQILKGFEEGRVTREALAVAAANLLRAVLRSASWQDR